MQQNYMDQETTLSCLMLTNLLHKDTLVDQRGISHFCGGLLRGSSHVLIIAVTVSAFHIW
jgi:hypothetical protein